MFCSKCGKEISDDMKFCPNCGNKTSVTSFATKKIQYLLIAILCALILLIIIVLINVLTKPANTDQAVTMPADVQADTKEEKATSQTTDVEEKKEDTKQEVATTKEPTPTPTSTPTEEPTSNDFEPVARQMRYLLTALTSRDDYNPNPAFPALAAYDDFDKNGTTELMFVYETKDYTVNYELWTVSDTNYEQMWESQLFTEVGGNSGIAGIALKDGVTYVMEKKSEPAGDYCLDMTSYYPFNKAGNCVSFDESYYFEVNGSYETPENFSYISGDTRVDKSEYESRLSRFNEKCFIDIIAGGGGGAVDVLPIDDMLRLLESK